MNYVITWLCGFMTFPLLLYIGYPLFKKWLIKKAEEWKTPPKTEEKKNES